MWQTDTERSEALEQMGAKRSDVLVFQNTTRVPKKNVEEKKIIKKQKKKISFLLNPSPSSAKMLDISTNIASFSWGKLCLFW